MILNQQIPLKHAMAFTEKNTNHLFFPQGPRKVLCFCLIVSFYIAFELTQRLYYHHLLDWSLDKKMESRNNEGIKDYRFV